MPVTRYTAKVIRPTQDNLANQKGVGLLEVLLAVVVLSIGFLAAARMQVEGMQANQTAMFNSQANFILRDITDRMRANVAGVRSGQYNGMTTTTAATLPVCITSQTVCTPAQLAVADLYNWRSKLYAPMGAQNFVPALPSAGGITARGEIDFDVVAGAYTVTMFWAEYDKDGVAVEQNLQVRFTP